MKICKKCGEGIDPKLNKLLPNDYHDDCYGQMENKWFDNEPELLKEE